MNLSFYEALDRIPLGGLRRSRRWRRGLALLAGAFWAAYILLSARIGRLFRGGSGLSLAMLGGHRTRSSSSRCGGSGVGLGALMSLEPAVAALAGFVVLGQDLRARELAAIVLVVTASAGAAQGATVAPRDA